MKPVFAPRALRDIEQILAYISSYSVEGANKVSLAIEHTILACAANPRIGAKTDEPSVYRFPLSRYRYTIFYRVDDDLDVLEIVRVIHSARIQDLQHIPRDE